MFNTQHLNKVSIVGCGKVGMTVAYALLQAGSVNELVLHGRCVDDIKGEQLDLEHGMAFMHPARVYATDKYEDLVGSDIVVYTAGAAQKPGETRLDLAEKNVEILDSILPKLLLHAPQATYIIVSNPVDVLTHHAYKTANLPKGQLFGTGTTLDTARFRFHLSEFIKVNPKSIHAYVLGEHGDTSFPVISSANVGGQSLFEFPNFSQEKAQKAFEKAKEAAYRIISAKGATYYGIGSVVAHIVKMVLTDAKSVLPLSIPLHNYHDISGVSLSVPCVLGRGGVIRSLSTKLSWEEKLQLRRSANALKKYA